MLIGVSGLKKFPHSIVILSNDTFTRMDVPDVSELELKL